MKGRISNKMGEIQISPEVIALYAGTIAVECFGIDRKSTRLNSSHIQKSRMPSSA